MAEDGQQCVACQKPHQAAAWYARKGLRGGREYLAAANTSVVRNTIGTQTRSDGFKCSLQKGRLGPTDYVGSDRRPIIGPA